MPLEFYYNGHLRWSFFWENPNYFAAFLACLLGWLWWGQQSLRFTVHSLQLGNLEKPVAKRRNYLPLALGALFVVFVLELGLWFLLAKTYSRGGLLAAGMGMLFFFILHGLRGTGDSPVSSMGCQPMFRKWHGRLARVLHMGGTPMPHNPTGWQPVLRNLIVRIALVAVICTAVGFSSRMAPGYMTQDNSVLNRFEMWKGAMVMMNDTPFHGWGRGMGGMAYVNWYQPLEAPQRSLRVVNSYLEVAVEHGTPVLFISLACALALVLLAARQRSRHTWALAAGSVLVTWLTANLLTSLWAEPTLWILPAIAMIGVIVGALLATPGFPLKTLAISSAA